MFRKIIQATTQKHFKGASVFREPWRRGPHAQRKGRGVEAGIAMLVTHRHWPPHSLRTAGFGGLKGTSRQRCFLDPDLRAVTIPRPAVARTSSMNPGTLRKQFHHLDASTSRNRRARLCVVAQPNTCRETAKQLEQQRSDENRGCRRPSPPQTLLTQN